MLWRLYYKTKPIICIYFMAVLFDFIVSFSSSDYDYNLIKSICINNSFKHFKFKRKWKLFPFSYIRS